VDKKQTAEFIGPLAGQTIIASGIPSLFLSPPQAGVYLPHQGISRNFTWPSRIAIPEKLLMRLYIYQESAIRNLL
jgi:hypothetical protein